MATAYAVTGREGEDLGHAHLYVDRGECNAAHDPVDAYGECGEFVVVTIGGDVSFQLMLEPREVFVLRDALNRAVNPPPAGAAF
ncbi:MAG: hypothetical protein ABI595_06370 [Actinomycetota bacterium]